ncbi:hypothetical protein L1987_37681 [Smallanthus sonchifolius]|uniref:Uncharacterized protein n=1 Tax=Smallanthus sonchifolius TaxID=185202 RepID=A0ACB9HH09_9ASTR|nr:hypothetical protein L1987_37681 [Smallanthus sonchifolius]
MDIQILDCGENNVELVNNGQEAKSTCLSKLQEISKVDENMSIVSFSSYHLTHTFHHLRHIYFNGFKGVKVMFEIESPSNNGELVTSQHQPLHLLPCLEEIELQNMDTLSHVWKWKDFYIFHKNQPQSFSFENLTSINLSTCNGMKYLFSPLMFKHLSSLKEVRISYCESMEEVVSNRDDDNEVLSTSTSTTTLFPHLDFLCFVCLYNLSSLNGTTNVIHEQVKFSQVRVVTWSLCQYAREIRILECPALSSVIPYYAAGQVQELQDLTVDQCKSMVELFETKKISNNGCTSSNVDQGSDNILPIISRPKQTVMHEFPNLMILKISKCNLLEYIFTFSTLESLKKLESLSIVDCAALKVIVREENEEASSKVVVVFPRLKSIELDHLPNLGGFLLEMSIDFQLPSVDYVLINDCPQMMVFTSGQTATPKLKYIHTRLGKHNLACGLNFHRIPSPSSDTSSSCPEGIPWSFHNLIEMYLDDNTRLKTIVQSSELIKLQNLEKITLNDCQHVEEVFEEVTNAKSETVVKFTNLREVELNWANNLRYIWKSNSQFPNLTRVFIHLCNNLEHVFTSSMVSSLMQLQELHISSCKRTEEIVKKEEECDGKVSEVIFPCLKSLQLENLWSLKGFSLGKDNLILPSLNTLVIKECPKIRIFSEGCSIAPQLKVVETSFGVFHVGKDINSFIMTKNQEGIIFGGLEEPSSPPCLVM